MSEFTEFLQKDQDLTTDRIIKRFGKMCKNTAYNYLKKWGIHIKKTFLYEEKRRKFIEKIAEIGEKNLVFIDESGIEDNEFYAYGWAKKGKRLYANKPAFKRKRISITGALNEGKIKAPCVFKGYCNSQVFTIYVRNILIPILKQGQIVILDNASFYKSERVRELIENAGCKVLFLPPYSPDLNPIEHFWFAVKHSVRKVLPTF